MPIPDFILEIRALIGHRPLWLPGVTAVVRRDDELLLVQRSDNGAWTPVTGIPEPGEEPAAAAVREVLEETGVTARVDRLASTWVHGPIAHANGDLATYLDLTFSCTWLDGDAHVADDESRMSHGYAATTSPRAGSPTRCFAASTLPSRARWRRASSAEAPTSLVEEVARASGG